MGTPGLKWLYTRLRAHYQNLKMKKATQDYFVNYDDFSRALRLAEKGQVDIQTKDGLLLTIRKNI